MIQTIMLRRIVSSDEFMPAPQSPKQCEFEARVKEIGTRLAKHNNMSRRNFFKTAGGMAAAFVAMNETYAKVGAPIYEASPAEAADLDMAQARADGLKGQFVMDMHTHFLRDDTPIRAFVSQREAVGKAAKDRPGLNFAIYHSAYRWVGGPGATAASAWDQLQRTGRVDWVTDLADIPAQFGVNNVYADLGQIFAHSNMAEPRVAAFMLGAMIKGLGADHVVWGTDALWTGAPQWQIEALRRMEIPDDVQKKYGLAPMGPADGPVKRAILGSAHPRKCVGAAAGSGRHDELDWAGGPGRLRYGLNRGGVKQAGKDGPQ